MPRATSLRILPLLAGAFLLGTSLPATAAGADPLRGPFAGEARLAGTEGFHMAQYYYRDRGNDRRWRDDDDDDGKRNRRLRRNRSQRNDDDDD